MADNLKIDMSKYSNIDDNGNIIQPQSGGALNAIVNSAPMNALLGFGDAAGDFIRGGLHLAGKPFGTSFDPATLIQQKQNAQGNLQFQPMQSAQGGAYNIGHVAGSVAPIIGLSELAPLLGAGRLSEALPQSLKLAPNIAGWAGVGAVGDPNNPMKGAEEGAVGGALGELIAPAVRGVGKLADSLSEKFYPEKFSKELVDKLKENYSQVKQESKNMYDSIINNNKEGHIIDQDLLYKDVLSDNPSLIDRELLNKENKTLLNKFMNDPTVYNAHKLQSKIGEQAYDVSNPSYSNYNKDLKNDLLKIKDNLNMMIENHLGETNLNDSNLYKQARVHYASQVTPYMDNKNLYDIVSNKTRNIDPSDLSKALEDVSNQTKVPESHYISQANSELEKRLFGGKILGKTLQKTPGAQLVAPGMASILSSPLIRNSVSKLQTPYDFIKNATLSNFLQGNK